MKRIVGGRGQERGGTGPTRDESNSSGRGGRGAATDCSPVQPGKTALLRGRNVERALGFERIHFKFEGGNPTGSQKDRAAFELARRAAHEGYEVTTLATCGNFGVAAAYAAQHSSLRTLIFFPERYHTRRLAEMTRLGAEVIRVDGDYEAAVAQSREAAKRTGRSLVRSSRSSGTLHTRLRFRYPMEPR